jgi:hypothetical protein
MRIFLFILLILCLNLITCNAQPIWLFQRYDDTVSLEILKAHFKDTDYTSPGTSIFFLSARLKGPNNVIAVCEIPYTYVSFKSYFGEDAQKGESSNYMGNPYLGIEIHSDKLPLFGEIGLRMPIAPNDRSLISVFVMTIGDFIDRAEAFAPAFPINFALNCRIQDPSGLNLRFRLGSAAWIPTKEENELDWYLLYCIDIGYALQKADLKVGISGRRILTERDIMYGERSLNQFVFAVSYNFSRIQPSLSFRLPLDEDLSEFIDYTIGLAIEVGLN